MDAYRKLTDIPHPEFQVVKVKDLIGSVLSLLQSDLKKRGIKVLTKCKPESLQLYCDNNLMEQVLINVITSYSIHYTKLYEVLFFLRYEMSVFNNF